MIDIIIISGIFGTMAVTTAIAIVVAIAREACHRRRQVAAQTELGTMESGKDYPHVTKPHPCVTR